MADTRAYSDGYLNIIFVPINGLSKPDGPTAAEINAGLNLSAAVAWDGSTFPAMSESTEVDDRSILDAGNATSRGFTQYEGGLSMFYPRDQNESVSVFGKAFQMLKLPGGAYWVITRVLQNVKHEATPVAVNDIVSVYKFIADTFINELDGETAFKYHVNLLPQGAAYGNTLAGPIAAPTVTNASGSGSIAVGEHAVLRAVAGGHNGTQMVRWESSDPAVANVSQNGVVTGVSSGSADITASHPSATAASTPISIAVT